MVGAYAVTYMLALGLLPVQMEKDVQYFAMEIRRRSSDENKKEFLEGW
jgi:hypothetical protein